MVEQIKSIEQMPAQDPEVDHTHAETGHNAFRLIEEIVRLSVAQNWVEARLEWSLERVFRADRQTPGTCLCGHFPIIEHCVLVNRENGNGAVVGNVCVQKFLGLASGSIFHGLHRVMRDGERALNAAAIEHVHGRGLITDWERRFYLDTLGKRRLSPKQRAKRAEINAKALRTLALRPRRCRQPLAPRSGRPTFACPLASDPAGPDETGRAALERRLV